MRVISGSLSGRNFASPHSRNTRPMSQKMRGALFNALGDISGLSFLDAFTGSGALAFEAISRGAAQVIAIDNDKAAQQAVAASIKLLGISQNAKLVKASAAAWLSTTNKTFDIVLLDPPYDNIQPDLLLKLMERTKLGGIAVVSLPPSADFKLSSSFELLSAKNYGDAGLIFGRRTS